MFAQMQPYEVLGVVAFLATVSVGVAAACHYLIEAPAQRRLRRVIDRVLPAPPRRHGVGAKAVVVRTPAVEAERQLPPSA